MPRGVGPSSPAPNHAHYAGTRWGRPSSVRALCYGDDAADVIVSRHRLARRRPDLAHGAGTRPDGAVSWTARGARRWSVITYFGRRRARVLAVVITTVRRA